MEFGVSLAMGRYFSVHLHACSQTQNRELHQVPEGDSALLDREVSCWKTRRLTTGRCTISYEQENPVLAVKRFVTTSLLKSGVRAKNLEGTLSFVDFSKAFDFIYRGKTQQILLAHGLSKETVAAIIILYKNTKVKVHRRETQSTSKLLQVCCKEIYYPHTCVLYA